MFLNLCPKNIIMHHFPCSATEFSKIGGLKDFITKIWQLTETNWYFAIEIKRRTSRFSPRITWHQGKKDFKNFAVNCENLGKNSNRWHIFQKLTSLWTCVPTTLYYILSWCEHNLVYYIWPNFNLMQDRLKDRQKHRPDNVLTTTIYHCEAAHTICFFKI